MAMNPQSTTPRQVRVVSLGFHDLPLTRISQMVAEEGARGADLVALPETFNGQGRNEPETLEGATVSTLAPLARQFQMYIVCPIDRLQDGFRLNSSILLDREGQIAHVYDKTYPYWSEFELAPPVDVIHSTPSVIATDFGRVGMAVCFDVNFPDVWQALADADAELVIWPSAYSAGRALQAHAINHHYYIVTSTYNRDCIVYDITGEEILYEKTSEDINVTRTVLDLDRGIYHENFNLDKRDRLLKEHAAVVEMEQWLGREQWFVLHSKSPDISVRDLARQYGLEELRAYKRRSLAQLDARRIKGPSALPYPAMAG